MSTCKIREIVLAPIQIALESSNKKLNADALVGFEVSKQAVILTQNPQLF